MFQFAMASSPGLVQHVWPQAQPSPPAQGGLVKMRHSSLNWPQLTSPPRHSAWAEGDLSESLDRRLLPPVRNGRAELLVSEPWVLPYLLFSERILNACSVPGRALGARDIKMNKTLSPSPQ